MHAAGLQSSKEEGNLVPTCKPEVCLNEIIYLQAKMASYLLYVVTMKNCPQVCV